MLELNESQRHRLARTIDHEAWRDVDQERLAYPADPLERFLGHPRVKLSLAKVDVFMAYLAKWEEEQ